MTASSHVQMCDCNMNAAMSEVRAAGFVVFRHVKNRIEYLMMQTSYGEHHWTPPKGHVDPGESDFQTALRETNEEAGLTETDLKIIDGFKKVINYNVKGRPKVVVYWIAELVSDKRIALSNEHQAYEWATLERACYLAKYPEMKETIRDCNTFISANKFADK